MTLNFSNNEITKIKIENFERHIYEINDIGYKNKALRDYKTFLSEQKQNLKYKYNIKKIDDPVFLLDCANNAYFHIINDQLLHYEFLKIYYPNLKMFIVNSSTNDSVKEKNFKIFQDIIGIYKIPEEQLILYNDISNLYIFNKIVYISSDFNNVLIRSLPTTLSSPSLNGWSDKKDLEFLISQARPKLLKSMEKYLNKKTSPKKIFISRERENNLLRSGAYRDNARWRVPSENEDLMLKNFFENHGYQTVFAQDLSLMDQISLYYNATHIAAQKSSAFVNTIFCQPGTQIISINLDKYYMVWYDVLCQSYDLKYLEIPEMINNNVNLGKKEPYYIYETLGILKSNYSNIL